MTTRKPSDGFVPPDLVSAVDVDRQLNGCPDGYTVRGMFVQEILDAADRAGRPLKTDTRYLAWRSYPTHDYVRIIAEGSALVHPDVPLAEAIFRVGHQVYPNFAATMIGRTIFAIAGKDYRRVAELAPRAYKAAVDGGVVAVTIAEPGYVRVRMTDLWPFPALFQAGVWHGGMAACDVVGDVFVRVVDDANVELEAIWQP